MQEMASIKEILMELECTTCLEYMLPPITICSNGHNICSRCKSQLSGCSKCKGQFTEIRNFALENMAENIRYPCRHAISGCKAEVPYQHINSHESLCNYQRYKCPFTFGGNTCRWDGPANEMKAHLSSYHPISCFQTEGARKLLRKVTFLPQHRWLDAVFVYNAIFISSCVIAENLLHHRVMFVGPVEKAKHFQCRTSVIKVDGSIEIGEYKEISSYKKFMVEATPESDHLSIFFLKDSNYFKHCLRPIDKYLNSEKCIEMVESIEREQQLQVGH
ncbi:hypothetical protein C0J52_20424 [Blattella germanica]|nr:hypothetical protein C0J52_20424 [Blattella germanica]